MIRRERQASENILLLDAGDTLFGQSGPSLSTEGKVIVEAMNLLGYDAMALGDRDLRLGLEALRQRMSEANFPILSANVLLSESGELLTKPYVVVSARGHKVAIVGLTGGTSPIADVVLTDPLTAAQQYVSETKKEADIVIVLSHLGLEMDQKLADEVEGIDLIVGGHSRSPLEPPLRSEKSGTVIVQAGSQGKWIGVVKLHIDGQGRVMSHEGELVLLTPDFTDDPEMKALLDKHR